MNSWEELMGYLFHDSWNDHINRYRSPYVYRGMSNKGNDLSTTLDRLGEPHLERHLLRNFMKYSTDDSVHHERPFWHWLALANHHGLPTRLLDWSYSPLVALHFATVKLNTYDEDGAIWAVNYVDSKNHLPKEMADVISSEGSHIFTAELLDEIVDSLSDLKALKDDPYVVFIEPPSVSQRIVNQYAVFSMMSDAEVKLHEWLFSTDIKCFKIIIPADLKWEIRDKLDQSNINERVLFPGLDGLASWLKRQYTPTKKKS